MLAKLPSRGPSGFPPKQSFFGTFPFRLLSAAHESNCCFVVRSIGRSGNGAKFASIGVAANPQNAAVKSQNAAVQFGNEAVNFAGRRSDEQVGRRSQLKWAPSRCTPERLFRCTPNRLLCVHPTASYVYTYEALRCTPNRPLCVHLRGAYVYTYLTPPAQSRHASLSETRMKGAKQM